MDSPDKGRRLPSKASDTATRGTRGGRTPAQATARTRQKPARLRFYATGWGHNLPNSEPVCREEGVQFVREDAEGTVHRVRLGVIEDDLLGLVCGGWLHS